MTIKDYFILNRDSLKDYFDNVKVSNDKTLMKFSTVENERISLNFFIQGKLNNSIKDYNEKINHLFNTSADLSLLDTAINNLKTPVDYYMSPVIKINNHTYAFQFSINNIGYNPA